MNIVTHRKPEMTPEQCAGLTIFQDKDIANRLPPAARAKLVRLRAELVDRRALMAVLRDEYTEIREKMAEVECRIGDLTRRENLADHHPLVVAEHRSLEGFRAQIAARAGERDLRKAAVAALDGLVKNLERYCLAVSPQTPTAPAPTAARFGSVEATRARLAELRGELEIVRAAPIPSGEAKDIMRAHIEALAAKGCPDVFPTLEGGQSPALAREMVPDVIVRGVDDAALAVGQMRDTVDSAALIAWLHKDALIAKLEREIDSVADDSSALTAEERRKRLHALRADILQVERDEESLIEAIERTGAPILRRADADPRAVLYLAAAAPEPKPL